MNGTKLIVADNSDCKRCPVRQIHFVSDIEYCIPFEPPWNGGFSRDNLFWVHFTNFAIFEDFEGGSELPDTF